MKKIVVLYNLLLASIITMVGLASAKGAADILISLAFLPVAIYFTIQLFKKAPQAMHTQKKYSHQPIKISGKNISLQQNRTSENAIEGEVVSGDRQARVLNRMGIKDADRRIFLKFLGTSSLTMFLFAIFSKKAQAAFFGSIPGPGTVSVKDSSGNTIDPAEKQPTDGYEVAELDDSGVDTYYGFIHKDGSWYITQESSTGSYRYIRGASSFSTSWDVKETLTYNTFDNVF